MRMSFDVDDERAFRRARTELSERFAAWAERQGVEAEPSDVELMLDWKVGYGDGQLDRWSAADAEEFLLGWYPRKVVAPEDMWDAVPPSVVAYVDFLAHEGLLAPGSSAAAVRRHVREIAPRFRKAMAEPANFGMAKSMFGGGGGGGEVPAELLERVAAMTGTSPDELLDVLHGDEPQIVGPVRRASDDEVAAAAGGSRTLRQLGELAAACAPPGLVLDERGDLAVADARRLAAELATGDDDEDIESAAELLHLSWLVDVALEAGAVRRAEGRLVAADRLAGLPPVEAYGRVVRAAFEIGLGSELGDDDELAGSLLARMLDEGEAGVPLVALLTSIGDVTEMFGEWSPESAGITVDRAEFLLEQLVGLGLLARAADDVITATAAGRAVGSEILAEAGMEVIWRADPATADAAGLVRTLFMLEEDDAAADLAAWWAAHPAGADDLVAAILDEDLATGVVLSLLEMAATVVGPPVEVAARDHRDGPREALLTMWLLTRGALDPATVDPAQMLDGTVEIAAAVLDEDGPDGVVAFFDTDPEQTGEVLDHLWRAGHHRTADVLDALGRHHPDKKVAKAARKSRMKLRNRS